MTINEAYIGMRVVCTSPFCGKQELVGKHGRICALDMGGYEVGVEFDEGFVGGHECGGKSQSLRGRYGYFDEIEPEEVLNPEITMSYEDCTLF